MVRFAAYTLVASLFAGASAFVAANAVIHAVDSWVVFGYCVGRQLKGRAS